MNFDRLSERLFKNYWIKLLKINMYNLGFGYKTCETFTIGIKKQLGS